MQRLRFPSDSNLEIPTLDPRFEAKGLIRPLQGWGRRKRRGEIMLGTWHFYVDDYRFDGLWSQPELVSETGAKMAIEPNFSAWSQCTVAEAVWQVYRKRSMLFGG